MTSIARIHALSLGLALAGCATPNGPVVGEWAGWTPSQDSQARKRVVLVLGGTPDAQSGTYHITSTETDPVVISGHGERQWGGTWVRSHRMVSGHTIDIIALKDHLPDDVGAYTLAPDGSLHVLDPDGLPDTTPAGALYTLSPVPPRNAG